MWRNAFKPRRLIPNLSSSGLRCLFHTLPELRGVPFCEANSNFRGFGRQADRYIRKCPANSGEIANCLTAFAFFGAWTFPAHTLWTTRTDNPSRLRSSSLNPASSPGRMPVSAAIQYRVLYGISDPAKINLTSSNGEEERSASLMFRQHQSFKRIVSHVSPRLCYFPHHTKQSEEVGTGLRRLGTSVYE